MRMLGMPHAPGDLLLSGATWLHCVMLVRGICHSNETSFLQHTTDAEVVCFILCDCENQKLAVALAGSGRWTLPSPPNGDLGGDLEEHQSIATPLSS